MTAALFYTLGVEWDSTPNNPTHQPGPTTRPPTSPKQTPPPPIPAQALVHARNQTSRARAARRAERGERERDQGILRERRGPAPRGVSASRGRAERREGRARVGMRGSDSPDEQASAAVRPARESCGVERRGTQCMQRSAVQAARGMDQAAAPTRS